MIRCTINFNPVTTLFLLFMAISHITGQGVFMQNNGNGNYDFMTTFQNGDLHFYLFDDGYHSFDQNPNHEYHTNNIPAQADLFKSGPYEDEDILEMVAGNPAEGTVNPIVPSYSFQNKIEVKKSWNLVPTKENYYILMFENDSEEGPLSGCVEFHFDTTQISVVQDSILDQYNSWVSNRSLENSEYVSEGYDQKYKWQFSGLSAGEQRFIYIPAECLSSKMDRVAVRGVIKYDCTEVLPYSKFNDGNLNHISSSNYFTLNEIVRGYPHDPNAIVTNPYALSIFDEAQTLEVTVFFQNEGKGPVQDVTIDFEMSQYVYDVQLISSSDPCQFSPVYAPQGIKEAQIVFPMINLPGMDQTNPTPNYYTTIGWCKMELCLDPTGWQPDYLYSQADIYFDSLAPITADHYLLRLINQSLNSNCTNPNLIRSAEKQSEYDLNDSKVFPNPTMDIVNIEIPEVIAQQEIEIQLFDLTGKLLRAYKVNDLRKEVDLSSLDNGAYILVITDEHGNKASKSILKY